MACAFSAPALLTDPRLVRLPPATKRGSVVGPSAGATAGGVVASAVLFGPIGLVAAAAAATFSFTNIRFQEAIWSDEVQRRLRAQTEAEPWRCVRAVVRGGGGLAPEEAAFLAARDVHVAKHLPAFLGEPPTHPTGSPSQGGSPLPNLRVSLVASGGGLRATVCHVAALSVARECGLLDCVTFCAGLSGSTWSLGAWYAAAVELMKDAGAAPPPPRGGAWGGAKGGGRWVSAGHA